MIKDLFWAFVFLVGVAALAVTPTIPEPAKLLLLAGVLVGMAFWGRRQFKRQENR